MKTYKTMLDSSYADERLPHMRVIATLEVREVDNGKITSCDVDFKSYGFDPEPYEEMCFSARNLSEVGLRHFWSVVEEFYYGKNSFRLNDVMEGLVFQAVSEATPS